MRKILLATTALVGIAAFAPAAQAQNDAPLNVTLGGYVDFRAGFFRESANNSTAFAAPAAAPAVAVPTRRSADFETEWRLNVDVTGKGPRGVEYGGRVSFWNGSTYNDGFQGNGTNVNTREAYVFLSGAYGKLVGGDHRGARDLFVYAPTVGLGQVDGSYTDFTDPLTLTAFQPTFFDDTETSTKITYLTPQVGNDKHKVQAAVSFAPQLWDQGQNIVKYSNAGQFNNINNTVSQVSPPYNTTGPIYKNFVQAAAQYQGDFSPVTWVFSPFFATGSGDSAMSPFKSFAIWGAGTQIGYAGFTLGGSYVDGSSFLRTDLQNRDQKVWTAGLKYEWEKYAVAISYLDGEGYNNGFAAQGTAATSLNNVNSVNYVTNFNLYSVGGAYTWFPGMATQADLAFFQQNRGDAIGAAAADQNTGGVFIVSQKLTF
ncbi:MAG: porin [Alphaproteobacteria bacterium]